MKIVEAIRGRTRARRVFDAILASEWAILPQWLEQFAGIAHRLGDGTNATLTAAELRAEIRRALAALRDGDGAPTSLALDYGEPLDRDSRVTVRDGVAILPVIGPLYHYADAIHEVCGCSSYAQIARDVAAIRENRERIGSVILEVDSPGGVVGGVAEAADLIAALDEELPVIAFVTDLGCSAAYWIASAAREIVVAETAMVGSIGVVAAFRVRKGDSDVIEIVSSQSPRKRPDVRTEQGRAQIQATIDALADVFIDAVARNRGVSREKVLNDFGAGDVFVGQHAVDAGLADRVATFEAVISELVRSVGSDRLSVATAAAMDVSPVKQEGTMPGTSQAPAADSAPAMTWNKAKETFAKELEAELQAARAEGAKAERERILAIQALAVEGAEAVIAECVNDPTCTVEGAALKIVEWQKKARASEGDKRKDALRKLEAAEAELDAPSPSASTPDAGSDEAVAARILSIYRPQRAAQ